MSPYIKPFLPYSQTNGHNLTMCMPKTNIGMDKTSYLYLITRLKQEWTPTCSFYDVKPNADIFSTQKNEMIVNSCMVHLRSEDIMIIKALFINGKWPKP